MIHAPPKLGIEDFAGLLQLRDEILSSEYEEVDVDCHALHFLDPVGICMFAWIADAMDQTGSRICLRNLRRPVAGYLHRMDALPRNVRHDVEGLDQRMRFDQRASLVELTKVTAIRDSDRVAQQIAEALVGGMNEVPKNDEPDEMTGRRAADYYTIPLQYVFSELLDNCLTHGRAGGFGHANAWVCAQYYRSRGDVCVAILDDGCGLLNSLRRHSRLPEHTHSAAIDTAILPRVSRNRDLEVFADSANQGLGLTVSRDIALSCGGKISIFTGDASKTETLENSEAVVLDSGWQGVGIYAQIPRESLRNVNIPAIVRKYIGGASMVRPRFED